MVNLVNKIICLSSHNTCIRLCEKEWEAFDEICLNKKIKRKALIEKIKEKKSACMGLTPAIRLFTLLYYKALYNEPAGDVENISLDDLLNYI
ncbi:MAG: ribbon-helix-helix domain-containing protein [Alphaproteobacteria bacterium]|nr:ribbon-helix-helix domain-containing protein [Alphaproteobacteria bacterium]